jgi:uncharacterized membrane-anchored protein
MLYPLADQIGSTANVLTAAVTLPVVLLVWLLVRRLRRHLEK